MPKRVFVIAPIGTSYGDAQHSFDSNSQSIPLRDRAHQLARKESSDSLPFSQIESACQDSFGTFQSSLSSMQATGMNNSRWTAAGDLETMDTMAPPRIPRRMPSAGRGGSGSSSYDYDGADYQYDQRQMEGSSPGSAIVSSRKSVRLTAKGSNCLKNKISG